MDRGDTNIVILGRPTVGKSVLRTKLCGYQDVTFELPDTSEKVESEAIKIGDWTKIVRVIPGQSTSERLIGLDEAFNKHKNLEGVIYVVDWGYTDHRDSIFKAKLTNDKNIKTIDDIRRYNLEKELSDFRAICTKIQEAFANGRGPDWFIVAANKADLFHENIDKAQEYYYSEMESEFSDILDETLNMVGRQNLKYASIPICSWEEDFTWNGNIVKGNIGGNKNDQALLKYFLYTISRLSTT